MKQILRSLYPFLAGCVLTISFSSHSLAMEFSVNSYDDAPDYTVGDGICSANNPAINPHICTLRAAIQEANNASGPDVVSIQSGIYRLSELGIGEDRGVTGDLDIFDSVTIRGAGTNTTIIDGAGIDRVLHVMGEAELTLEKVTVTGGAAFGNTEFSAGLGGGVLVADGAFLRLYYARVTRNKAVSGGGIGGWHPGNVEFLYSDVSHNEIRYLGDYVSLGGAFHMEPNPLGNISIQIMASTFAQNSCYTTEVGCYGGIVVPHCGDEAGASLLITNSTISGNEGDGLYIKSCRSTLENNTIYGNSGNGIVLIDNEFPAYPVTARNTIFANNGVADCSLRSGEWYFALNYNLSSDSTCDLNPTAIDDVNTDPELYPLGTYEPLVPFIVETHAPRWGSPVIDSGEDLITVSHDQEGQFRPMDGNQNAIASHDKGAIEVIPCIAEVDPQITRTTVTGGIYEACNQLTAGPALVINGAVSFFARDSVRFNQEVSVATGTVLSVRVARWAGRP